MIIDMKKFYSLVAMSMMAGAMLLCSCSSDEDSVAAEQPVQPAEQPTTFVDVVDQVKTRSNVDFSGLKPLKDAVKARAAEDDTSDDQMEMLLRLLKLLEFLMPEDVTQPGERGHYRWTFANMDETLKLTIDVLQALDGRTGLPNSGIVSDQITIVAEDGTVYTINAKLQRSLIGAPDQYFLEVLQGDKVLLAGNVERTWPVGVGEQMATGSLTFEGNEFILSQVYDGTMASTRTVTYNQNGTQLAVIKLKTSNDYTFAKMVLGQVRFAGDLEVNIMDNLAVIKSHVKSLNRFYLDALDLTGVSRTGTSKENCQIICDGFNDNTTTTLLLAGINLGTLTLAPTQSDAVRNLYKPTILVASPLLGDREMTIQEVMEAMGVSLDDVLNLLLGAQDEEGENEGNEDNEEAA